MIVDKLEDTLNGGYSGLYGEVVDADTYRLKTIDFAPGFILDIGGNVGCFSRFARRLFPNAMIVAIEPNSENYQHFVKFTEPDDKMIIINKAIGIGQIYHGLTARNGSGETYLSTGLGYPKEEMEGQVDKSLEKSSVETIMPDEILKSYLKDGVKSIVKIDCEGAENFIWTHESSMVELRKVTYLCMEIHNYAIHGGVQKEVDDITTSALKSFEVTHDCERDGVHFWATLKK